MNRKALPSSALQLVAIVCVFAATPAPAAPPVPEGYVDASTYGWTADDATAALQAAVDTGRNVFVRKMPSDWVVAPIKLWRDEQTILFERGAIVRAKRGAFRGLTDSLFSVHGRGVRMVGRGASLVMQQADYVKPPYAKSEWRHAIEMRAVSDLTIDGLTIKDTGGDGIYVGNIRSGESCSKNIIIKNVTINNAYRNGISVISVKNLLIDNCVIVNSNGTDPRDGIDFEPNHSTEVLENITIRNTIVDASGSVGIQFSLKAMAPERLAAVTGVIENVTVVRNAGTGIQLNRFLPGLTIKDCLIGNGSARGILGVAVDDQTNTITHSCLWANKRGSARYFTLGTGTIEDVAPVFHSTDVNSPYYMYLDPKCSPRITKGASDGSHMGARPVYQAPQAAPLRKGEQVGQL